VGSYLLFIRTRITVLLHFEMIPSNKFRFFGSLSRVLYISVKSIGPSQFHEILRSVLCHSELAATLHTCSTLSSNFSANFHIQNYI